MISVETALVAAVTAELSLSALIGTNFFPVGGRQGTTYPYVTWQRISTQGAPTTDGPSNLDWPRFQLDTWAPSAIAALRVAEALRTFLDANEHSAGGLAFMATFQDQRGPAFDETTRNFGVSQDYFLWHGRS